MNTNATLVPHRTSTTASDATSRLTDSGRRRFAVNITPAERGGRIAIGLAAIIVAVVLLASAGSALAAGLEVLLIAAGLDLVITGTLGHCPLFQRLGHVPASLRGSA